jgi:hypothetical protein
MMINKIEAVKYQTKHADAAHLVFAIDGMPLDVWLQEHLGDQEYIGLVPALTWLRDERKLAVAWERIIPCISSQVAPILVCPDDQDFSCTVVVAEICKENEEEICWRRLGIDMTTAPAGHPEELGTTVEWIKGVGPLRFRLAEYIACIEQFKLETQGHVDSEETHSR